MTHKHSETTEKEGFSSSSSTPDRLEFLSSGRNEIPLLEIDDLSSTFLADRRDGGSNSPSTAHTAQQQGSFLTARTKEWIRQASTTGSATLSLAEPAASSMGTEAPALAAMDNKKIKKRRKAMTFTTEKTAEEESSPFHYVMVACLTLFVLFLLTDSLFEETTLELPTVHQEIAISSVPVEPTTQDVAKTARIAPLDPYWCEQWPIEVEWLTLDDLDRNADIGDMIEESVYGHPMQASVESRKIPTSLMKK